MSSTSLPRSDSSLLIFRSMQNRAAVSGSSAMINWPGLVIDPMPAYSREIKEKQTQFCFETINNESFNGGFVRARPSLSFWGF